MFTAVLPECVGVDPGAGDAGTTPAAEASASRGKAAVSP